MQISFLNDDSLPLQLRLDCLDVTNSIRPAARILLNIGTEVEKVCRALIDMGVAISVAKGIKKQRRSGGITLHDWFEENASDTGLVDMVVLYVARDQSIADETRAADETQDDFTFGRALGYPGCCVKWVHDRGRVPEISECLKLYSKDHIYDPLPWPTAMLVDAPLTPHYPCSSQCQGSISIANHRLCELKRLGASNILQKLHAARCLIYWLDSKSNLNASQKEDFKISDASDYARPSSMPIIQRPSSLTK